MGCLEGPCKALVWVTERNRKPGDVRKWTVSLMNGVCAMVNVCELTIRQQPNDGSSHLKCSEVLSQYSFSHVLKLTDHLSNEA